MKIAANLAAIYIVIGAANLIETIDRPFEGLDVERPLLSSFSPQNKTMQFYAGLPVYVTSSVQV